MRLHRNCQQGFAAIAAIFLVVVLAALGGFMLTFSNAQQLTSVQDLQGTKAYWAARAGLEWAVVAVPATPALCPNAAATQVAVASVPSPIDGYAIKVFCSKNTFNDAGTVTIFGIEAQASSGTAGTTSYIERSVSASLEQ